ncbi:DUF4388 domain-containing protein [bacterium]|nr:DUF4388 domain-containing protein [candidate division CSSED10-310 bacterium]
MSVQGNLSTMSLTGVLQLLHTERQNGVIEVRINRYLRQLMLESGLIVNVQSSEPKHHPYNYLEKQRLLTPVQVEKLWILKKVTGESSFQILHDLGLIKEEALREIVRLRFKEIVLETMEMKEGDFSFREGMSLDALPFAIVPLATMEMIMEAGRRKDEWERIRQEFPSFNLVLKRAGNTDKDVSKLKSYVARRIMAFVDGHRSLYEIYEDTGFTEFQAYYTLLKMSRGKLVQVVGEKDGAPASLVDDYLDRIDSFIERGFFLEARRELTELDMAAPGNVVVEEKRKEIALLIRKDKVALFSNDYQFPVLSIAIDSKEFRNIPMSATEGFLLSRIDGKTPLHRIVSLSGVAKDDAYDTLYKFYKMGIIKYSSYRSHT